MNSLQPLTESEMKLPQTFYERTDVVKIARDLLGKWLLTKIDGVATGGVIVETEAYSWKERGCHAFGRKKTQRTEVMFGHGGVAYVYLCYGMHHMFNVVTNKPDVPEAILIRAIEPRLGLHAMQQRRGLLKSAHALTSGPGKVAKALGINKYLNGKYLSGEEIWIEDRGEKIKASQIEASPRIGIDYAGEDAKLLWRFTMKENPWVSR